MSTALIPRSLKEKQRKFKKNKPCAICGCLLEQERMTVDHIIPKAYYENWYETKNWQVLCVNCHNRKTKCESFLIGGHKERITKKDFKEIPGLKKFDKILNKHKNISPEASR